MNYAACNVESRPPKCWNSISTAQLVELTANELKIILRKTSTAHPASRQSGHGASTPEVSSDTVRVGEQDEVVSGREVILIAKLARAKTQKYVQEKLRSLLRAAAAI